jgi:hypothetical protein
MLFGFLTFEFMHLFSECKLKTYSTIFADRIERLTTNVVKPTIMTENIGFGAYVGA